jgi:hypothetical protein
MYYTCTNERVDAQLSNYSADFEGEIMLKRIYRSTVTCIGLSEEEAKEAVADMLLEFAERPWQEKVNCEWRDGVLRLSAQNDTDANGLALLDEFGDAITAYINYSGDIKIEVESVIEL